jgi:hypothetical protein
VKRYLKTFNIDSSKSFDTTLHGISENDLPFLTEWGVDLLSKFLSRYVKTIIVESNYICKDYRDVYSNYYSKKFFSPNPLAYRLHFFSERFKNEAAVIVSRDVQNSYIGYSVVRDIKERCIGRTIIDPEKVGLTVKNNYFKLTTTFYAHILGIKLKVNGYPFMSQDEEANVCAHSALWGACRFLSEKFTKYKEIYPFDLVKLTGNSSGRTYPYRGMTYSDYSKILSEFGCYPLILQNLNKKIFQEQLYSYVESGFPVLASYGGHVVTLIGHTINYNKKIPAKKNKINSHEFLREYIVIDDNFYPYQLLGYRGKVNNYGSEYLKSSLKKEACIDGIITAVIPLPEKAFLTAEKAKKFASQLIPKYTTTLKKNNDKIVQRLFLTTGVSFKHRKKYNSVDVEKLKVTDPASFRILQVKMPHFIWVMELSTIDEYKKGTVSGEIIIDATGNISGNSVIYIRIGEKVYLMDKNGETKVSKALPGTPKIFKQYKHNLGSTYEEN